jgi:hypothetical protein
MEKDIIIFNGITFVRYPQSKSKSASRYYYPFRNNRRLPGVGALHQAIWKHHNGPIPPGMQIHHKDEDFLNNDPSNLECLTRGEHRSKHLGCSPALRKALDRLRPLTKEWHASEEGLAWHSEHAKEIYKSRIPLVKNCLQCQSEFKNMARRDTDLFCSRACYQKWHYRQKTYWSEKVCLECQQVFLAPPSADVKCCSYKCAGRMISRTKNAHRPTH